MDTEALSEKLKELLLGMIRNIIMEVRGIESDTVAEEKANGNQANIVYIEISKLLKNAINDLMPYSLIIDEESFNKNVYDNIDNYRYIWVINPIDGTKALSTKGNNEYCVAVALIENGKPILSLIYSPEYEINGEKGCLFEARAGLEGAYLNGKRIYCDGKHEKINCVTNTYKDGYRTETQEKLAKLADTNEQIIDYDGHSALMHYCLVAVSEKNYEVFTKRSANIWDVIQSALIVVKAGGDVFYENGSSIIPIDYTKLLLEAEMNKLLIPFNIACSSKMKEKILQEDLFYVK